MTRDQRTPASPLPARETTTIADIYPLVSVRVYGRVEITVSYTGGR